MSDRDWSTCDLTAFVEAEHLRLVRFAFLISGGDASLAEDLVQTVLMSLLSRGLDGLQDPARYARRCIVNAYQRTAQQRGRAALSAVVEEDLRSATTQLDDRLTIIWALSALTDRERAAIVLRYYEDLDDTESAALIGCSRATVRSLIHRALPKLRTSLNDLDTTATEQEVHREG